jgi:hypothetical protein
MANEGDQVLDCPHGQNGEFVVTCRSDGTFSVKLDRCTPGAVVPTPRPTPAPTLACDAADADATLCSGHGTCDDYSSSKQVCTCEKGYKTIQGSQAECGWFAYNDFCDGTTPSCLNGLEKVGVGYNVLYGTQLGEAMKPRVIQLSMSSESKVTVGGTQFTSAPEVNFRLDRQLLESQEQRAVESMQGHKQSELQSLGLSASGSLAKYGLSGAVGSAAASSTDVKQALRKRRVTMKTVKTMPEYTLEVVAYTLDRKFDAELESLPDKFDPAFPLKFDAFFDKYGTHYVKSLKMGGKLEQTVLIDKCIYDQVDESTLKLAADMQIKQEVPALYTAEASSDYVEERAQAAAESISRYMSADTLRVSGGEPDYMSSLRGPPDYDAWHRSIEANPDVIDVQLGPLSFLLANHPKGAAVDQALKAYYEKHASPEDMDLSVSSDPDKPCVDVSEQAPAPTPMIIPSVAYTGLISLALLVCW